MLDASPAPSSAYFLNVALVPEDSGRVISTIASSAPPTSFQFVILPVKISVSCAFVRFLTPLAVTSLFTIGAIVTTHTLWSTSAEAFVASSFSAASTSELPILTVPSETCLRPSPDPPASIVIFTSGYFSLKRSAASSTSGLSAEEPAAVILPLSFSAFALSFPLSELLLPQPANAPTIHTVLSAIATLFFQLNFLIIILTFPSDCLCLIYSIPTSVCSSYYCFVFLSTRYRTNNHN